jgi:hypothetical protein
MNKLKLNNNLFYFSTLLVLAGILLRISDYKTASYAYLAGACLFTLSRVFSFIMYRDKTRGRLLQIQIFSGFSLIVSAVLMYRGSNSWSVFVLLTALIELYASFRGGNFQQKT